MSTRTARRSGASFRTSDRNPARDLIAKLNLRIERITYRVHTSNLKSYPARSNGYVASTNERFRRKASGASEPGRCRSGAVNRVLSPGFREYLSP